MIEHDTLARLTVLESRIGESEDLGLRARWEFGRELLAARDGKRRLPNGYLARVREETGTSRQELGYRMQFAKQFPSEAELSNVVGQLGSWHAIVRDALPAGSETLADGSEPTTPAESPPLPEGTYRVVVADPPWQYGNRATRGAAENHYGTMTIEELKALNVADRMAPDAHLYLWTTNGFLREAFEVVEAWGATYKGCLTWVKPQMGLGNFFRSATEHVLFGVRGSLPVRDRTLRNWFEAPRGRHSAKPACFYDLVERASEGPYLEMFAREARLGWSHWGEEALQDVEVAA